MMRLRILPIVAILGGAAAILLVPHPALAAFKVKLEDGIHAAQEFDDGGTGVIDLNNVTYHGFSIKFTTAASNTGSSGDEFSFLDVDSVKIWRTDSGVGTLSITVSATDYDFPANPLLDIEYSSSLTVRETAVSAASDPITVQFAGYANAGNGLYAQEWEVFDWTKQRGDAGTDSGPTLWSYDEDGVKVGFDPGSNPTYSLTAVMKFTLPKFDGTNPGNPSSDYVDSGINKMSGFVPVPGSLVMLASGVPLLGLVTYVRRKKIRQTA